MRVCFTPVYSDYSISIQSPQSTQHIERLWGREMTAAVCSADCENTHCIDSDLSSPDLPMSPISASLSHSVSSSQILSPSALPPSPSLSLSLPLSLPPSLSLSLSL